jgi:hypothetical protein
MRFLLNLLTALALVLTAVIAGQPWMGRALASGSPDSWATEPSMNSARAYLGLIGGTGADTHVYAIGGQTSTSTWVKSEEYFTPGGTSWTTDSISYGAANAGMGVAAGTDGKLYGAGGDNSGTAVAKVYSTSNPSTTAWTAMTAMTTARTHLGAATSASTGLIYAIGGNSGSTYLNKNEAYSTSAGTWTSEAAMPTARAHLAVVTGANGLIYAIGGYNGSSYLNTVEAYNPSTNTWTCSTGDTSSGCSSTTLAPMPTARTARAAVVNGIIYVIGGYNGSSYLDYVEAYNPTTNTWDCSGDDTAPGCSATALTAMPTARAYLGVALASDGTIYAAGGISRSTFLSTVQAYTPPAVPGTPTGVTAAAGDSSATVSWTAPTSDGGTPVTSYTVNCTPSCTPVTATGTSTTVAGLTNGTAYTFTVTATNFVGSGSASAASNSVTPVASCSTSSSNLSISGAAPGNFSATLNGKVQQLYTTLGSYTASNTTCSGWTLQFQATHLACSNGTPGCPAGGNQLPSGSLLMAPPTVSSCQSACGSGSTANPPSICLHSNTAIDSGAAVTVASAAQNTGDGTYTFTPGTIGSGNLQLTMPSYAYATTYSSTLTVTIAQGPAGSC